MVVQLAVGVVVKVLSLEIRHPLHSTLNQHPDCFFYEVIWAFAYLLLYHQIETYY